MDRSRKRNWEVDGFSYEGDKYVYVPVSKFAKEFDATIKKHHAPLVLKDATVEKRVDALLAKYGY